MLIFFFDLIKMSMIKRSERTASCFHSSIAVVISSASFGYHKLLTDSSPCGSFTLGVSSSFSGVKTTSSTA